MLAGKAIESMLYQTSPYDWRVVAGVTGFLVITAIIASMAPAVRAARIAPADALRLD
ncbi:hypothetical protein D3C83_156170 [compost metagenome]